MKIKQVSCFVENQPGRLEALLEALKAENVNIRALCVAETSEYGIMRMVLSDSVKGVEALRKAGFTVKETVVLQKDIPDQPGGLLDVVARPLAKAGVNLEYFYAFVDPTPGKASIVLKVSDPDKAEKVMGQ
jgi:hypothetical protein